VDGTGRIQSVTKQGNLRFYKLIKAFFDITGVPVLLNTSFNVKGEPIIETPEDALRCFLKTQIDILSIGDYLLMKNKVLI
jgi:carbamoyltransferase